LFVQLSVAVQVTTVLPTENKLPDGGAQLTGTFPPELSDAVGAGHETATRFVPQVRSSLFVGHSIDGGVVSRATVTVKMQVSRSPQSLVAAQLTVDVPTVNKLPEGGTQDTWAGNRQLFETAGAGYGTATGPVPQVQMIWLVGQIIRRGATWALTCAAAKASAIQPATANAR